MQVCSMRPERRALLALAHTANHTATTSSITFHTPGLLPPPPPLPLPPQHTLVGPPALVVPQEAFALLHFMLSGPIANIDYNTAT